MNSLWPKKNLTDMSGTNFLAIHVREINSKIVARVVQTKSELDLAIFVLD